MNKKDVINEKSINDINYELLKKQFPNAISIDEDGKYSIDTQKLQMSLDPSKANIKEDGYGLNWVGKKEAYHTAFSKNYKVLKPLNDDNSKNWDTTDNILIKGDNLDALKILRQNYFEAIKMIYIDPPYNTKNDDFVYNDDFTSNTKETLEELGYDEENIEYIENIQGAKTHSGWLSFMYPRLLLARDLLKDDGVIFISIDDNEVSQLKLLCDEVFGGDNFVGDVIRKTRTSSNHDEVGLNTQHENCLIYAKNKSILTLIGKKKTFDNYKNPDNDINGNWISDNPVSNLDKRTKINNFEIINPYTKKIDIPSIGNHWRFNEQSMKEMLKTGKLFFKKEHKKDERGFVLKRYQKDIKSKYHLLNSLECATNDFLNQVGTRERNIMFEKDIFDYPKPLSFLLTLTQSSTTQNDIILDFFAGSGTTAHAVMDLNSQDDGNRKFITVQLAEETPLKSEANKAGYNTIFDITQERIKRAGDKIIKDDLINQDLDIGFRTFEIVEDGKQHIYQKSLEDMTQEDLLAFTKNSIETNEDILYNLLVADSLPLSTKIEELIEDKLYLALNVAFVLGDITINKLIEKLKSQKELEYITIYSPNISDDKFILELESAVSSIGIKTDKIKFRG